MSKSANHEFGFEDGSICGRNGCTGQIETHPSDNCSCHISPPCSSCTARRNFCAECDWQEADEIVVNDYVVQVDQKTGIYKSWEPRPLDSTKIDWHSKPHSSCSMVKEGVFPEGASREEVRKLVDGTFGGRFEYFGNCRFKFIAYTD